MISFIGKLRDQWAQGKFLCAGIDPDLEKMLGDDRKRLTQKQLLDASVDISCNTIDATCDVAAAYKFNVGFFEELEFGGSAIRKIVAHAKQKAPRVPRIKDGKNGDIGNTNTAYARATFEAVSFDAMTVNPYVGCLALEPFLRNTDKGIIVLCRTSNPGSDEFQGRLVEPTRDEAEWLGVPYGKTVPFYRIVACRVRHLWNTRGNCALVVGATYPEELGIVRKIVGDDMPILVPGLGKQDGDLKASMRAGLTANGDGLIPNVGSDIMYAPEPSIAARRWHDNILAEVKAFEACE